MNERHDPLPIGQVSRRSALAATIAAVPAISPFARAETPVSTSPEAIALVSTFGVRPNENGEVNTQALNAGIRDLALRGGGTLVFDPTAAGYTIVGPVILPSNICIDLNNQVIRGRRQPGDALFITGTLSEDGQLRSNLDSAPETELVTNTAVIRGRIEDCQRVFYFRNFGRQCLVRDILTRNCIQVGRFERCFFATFSNLSAAGFSDQATPSFHFVEQTNAVTLHRLSAVTAFGLCIEAGAAAVLVDGFTFEGGETGVAMIGDALGIHFRGCYFEAVEGRAFDLQRAGTCTIDWEANYFNHVDVVLDDGSAETGATLFGTWHASNYIVPHSLSAFAKMKPARRQMRVDGPRNFILFAAQYQNDASPQLPANWLVSRNSRVHLESGVTGESLTDIRARTTIHGGILPVVRSGNTGAPIHGSVPYSNLKATRGNAAQLEIQTKIAWQPNSLFARFVFTVEDDIGLHRLYGDIYGSNIVQQDKTGKLIRPISRGGFLCLYAEAFTAVRSSLTCTGSIQVLT